MSKKWLNISVAEKNMDVIKDRKLVLNRKGRSQRQTNKIVACQAKIIIINSNSKRKIVFYSLMLARLQL